MIETIELTVNRKKHSLTIDTDRTLLWVLRTELNLTGAKYGCGEGYCGSCTVLMNSEPILSCQYSVKDVKDAAITTIEGLAQNEKLHPLQEAFVEKGALQCGYCTPGMILRAHGLISQNPSPSKKEIIEGMEDHLCRCGAHKRIIQAVQSAAKAMKGGAK